MSQLHRPSRTAANRSNHTLFAQLDASQFIAHNSIRYKMDHEAAIKAYNKNRVGCQKFVWDAKNYWQIDNNSIDINLIDNQYWLIDW